MTNPTNQASGVAEPDDERSALIQIARDIEGMKRECGMDPESPTAIYNGKLMSIGYRLRALHAALATKPAATAEVVAPPPTYGELIALGADCADTLLAIGRRIGFGRAQQILGEQWEAELGCAPRGRMGVTAPIDPPAQAPSTGAVYLVATGEVVDGQETYTRHEGAPPPLCDFERLYAAPPVVQPASPAVEVASEPVQWGDPKTVGMLIRQLQTIDPEEPIYAAFHADYQGKRRALVRGVTLSRERVVGRFIDSQDKTAPYSYVVWSQPVEEAPAAVTEGASDDAMRILGDIEDWLLELAQANFDGGVDQGLFAQARDFRERIESLATTSTAAQPGDAS